MIEPTTPQQRKYNTDNNIDRWESRRIVIPIKYEEYKKTMAEPQEANAYIRQQMDSHPELFPSAMKDGYKLHGWTEPSQKMPEVRLRRIRLQTENEDGQKLAYTIAPCDILPYLVGTFSEVEKALFLKQFGVPDWALTYVFGRDDSYWYRLTESFGRLNLVGTTVKSADNLPADLLADEKHAKAHGEKWYIATTVGQDCVLGAAVSPTADATGLTTAYNVFKEEARQLDPEYSPDTVNTDGWSATIKAWQTLFSTVTTILCFLHAFLKIRSRCKRLGDKYTEIKQQVWDIYRTENRTDFKQGIVALQQWAMDNRDKLTDTAIEAIDKLYRRADEYAVAFAHPTAYRTSNMLDRHMGLMARWLAGGRYFHGHLQAAELRTRAWALLHNYRPYCPRSKISQQYQSPAHKLNDFVYRDNWLENLLVASSCQGFRCRHKKRLN